MTTALKYPTVAASAPASAPATAPVTATAKPGSAQPQRLSHSSVKNSRPTSTVLALQQSESEAESEDRTPRPHHQTIGLKSSSETLKAKKSAAAAAAASAADATDSSRTSTPLTTASNTLSTASSTTAVSNNKPTRTSTNDTKDTPTPSAAETGSSISHKFSFGSKKKRQQRQEQEREERRLKEEANEALRKKHGEYHPPGHSQGQIHTHRSPPNHDRHQLERSRSSNNMRLNYQHQRSHSSIRIASPTSPVSPSPSPTPSSSSSTYSSRHNSYSRGRSRPTSPMRDMVGFSMDYGHANAHMNDLRDLDAESMLSEHWDSNSNSEDDDYLDRARARERERERELALSNGYSHRNDHQRQASVDTDNSFRTGNSSVVHFDLPPPPLRPMSPSSTASSYLSQTNNHSSSNGHKKYQNRSTLSVDTYNYPGIAQQIEPTDSHAPTRPDHVFLEMEEVGRPSHQSWQLKNASMTGIVTGLEPELDGPSSMPRPRSSLSRHHTIASKSREALAERYLYHSRSSSPPNSNVPSSSSNHRSHSRHRPHHSYHHSPHYGQNNGTMSDLSPAAMDAMRSKAGSRATGTIRGGDTTVGGRSGGGGETSSLYGTDLATDENNYLAPLPPFQQGPAYTRVPKRKFCKCCFGGCRWWVLLLLILIPAGLLAVVAAFLLHQFQVCVAIDPNTVDPMVYVIDPAAVQSIALEYQTRTKGNINIIDSPDPTETRVLLKLQRQFYKMKDQMALTGFQIDTLSNGTVHYVLNDAADRHREFFISTVLCSNSILTIEMPRAVLGRPELSIDALVDQQDVFIGLDESVARNATWRFKGLSNYEMFIQSLNVNALSISYTSTSPTSVTLSSVIVRDQLSVTTVSGNIQVSVGFSALSSLSSSNSNSSVPSTVNLNTLDGQIQLNMTAWNQTCAFQVSSPSIEVAKAGLVVLPFTEGAGGRSNSTTVNVNGLVASVGSNGVSGSYTPGKVGDSYAPPSPPRSIGTVTGTVTGTATATSWMPSGTLTKSFSTGTRTVSGTMAGTATPSPSATPTAPSSAVPPGPTLGAGGSSVPVQFMIQANKNVLLNFP